VVVKTGHIVPHCANGSTLNLLRWSQADLDEPCNCLLMVHNLEKAFDSLQLSLILVDRKNLEYEFKVHDDNVLNVKLYEGSARTIGEVTNCRHRLSQVSKRALALHNFYANSKANPQQKLPESHMFGTPEDYPFHNQKDDYFEKSTPISFVAANEAAPFGSSGSVAHSSSSSTLSSFSAWNNPPQLLPS